MKSNFGNNTNLVNSNSKFGDTLKFDVLRFELEQETGCSLDLTKVDSTITIYLKNKSDEVLSQKSFEVASRYLTKVEFDSANKCLIFRFAGESPLYCDLTDLYSYIDAEDTLLQTNIDQEVSNRTTADTTLQNNINIVSASVTAEATTRQTEDERIIAELDVEKGYRATWDASLQTAITDEATTRQTAINNIKSDLETKINTEKSRAEATEATLDNSITSEANTRESQDNILTQNLNVEITTRATNDNTLQNNIDTEAEIRTTADTTLQNNINIVSGNLSSEITRATSAESTLQSNIDTEATTRATNDSTLQTNINNEASIRASYDASLQDEIDNLKAKGRFLSVWNSKTGLPETDPTTTPYAYKTGDYFIVGIVYDQSEITETVYNKRPDGSEYVWGQASTTKETATVKANDYYVFDSSAWTLISATVRTYTFSEIAGLPRSNTNLDTEFTTIETTASGIRNDLETEVSNRTTAVSDEAIARATADTTLQTNITNEVSARETAIINEAAARADADTQLQTNINAKQDTLVSGTNIKTINSQSVLGSGNIEIEGVSDYNDLDNIPILNQDLTAEDFVPTVGTYYRHISESTGLRRLIQGGQYSQVKFNISYDVNTVNPMLEAIEDWTEFTVEEITYYLSPLAAYSISIDDDGVFAIKGEFSEIDQYAIMSNNGGIIYCSSAGSWSSYTGWNSTETSEWNPTTGVINISQTSAVINYLNNDLNGILFGQAVPSYNENTIYRCTSNSPVTYSKIALNSDIETLETTKLDVTKCTYQTTAPTAAISDGGVHIVYLATEPSNKYNGYIYLIAED